MRNWSVLFTLLCGLLVPSLTLAEDESRAVEVDRAPATIEVGSKYLEPLAAGLARALASDGFRQSLYEELSTSPYVEGRVALKRLLSENDALREELLALSDLAGEWSRLSEALPELELYFPIASHREAWRGDAEIEVMVPAGEQGRYRVISTAGSRRTLASDSPPPATPTLLLAESEIDFDDAESALEGGVRTGSYLRQVPPRSEVRRSPPPDGASEENAVSTKSSGVDTSRHTYLTAFHVDKDYDPYRGSMEIEVYGGIDGSYQGCQRFTGIDVYTYYYLPPPGSTGDKKIAYAVPTGSNTIDVDMYEDDDTGCVLKSGDDFVSSADPPIVHYGLFVHTTGWGSVRVETLATTCGDSACEGDESSYNCCSDCATCGDGTCQSQCGESGSTCSADCYTCGDGVCESWKGESYWNCSADCSSCGNGFCDPGEDYFSCPSDCCDGQRICPE